MNCKAYRKNLNPFGSHIRSGGLIWSTEGLGATKALPDFSCNEVHILRGIGVPIPQHSTGLAIQDAMVSNTVLRLQLLQRF